MPRLGLFVTATPDLRARLEPSVERRQALIAERERLNHEIGALSDAIGHELAVADQKSVKVGAFLVTLVEYPGRQTLDKHRLVELGVPAETIIAAMVRGAPSTSLQVRRAPEE